jgi:2-C-methyl-D-erythritol 2,4-cyclodiphosphate synthase
MIRIGHGYDAHRFAEDACAVNSGFITLGGVQIPHTHTLLAHSDGDVLIHALCDALLGALALGDIGQHFPDTATEFKNIDSRILLRKVMQLVLDAEYQIGNVDMTIIAQSPKMSPYLASMQGCLAEDLKANCSQINIKATTTENMGFTGRKEGIAAHAVVCLQRLQMMNI